MNMTNAQKEKLGLVGGTGLYSLKGLQIQKQLEVETPFGKPSAPLTLGRFREQEVVFLPRHGIHHELLPHEINYQANLFALKKVGVTAVVSVSATGSLQEEFAPGHLVVPDQYFDWTKKRQNSFFGRGLVGHPATAQVACTNLIEQLRQAAEKGNVPLHVGGTYACVEGPRLGTRAESFFLKNAVRASVVGMTNLPEAFLAYEAQMAYATLAIVTDYDCWKNDPEEFVTVEKVIERYRETIGKALHLLEVLCSSPLSLQSANRTSLEGAVLSSEERLSAENKEILNVLRS